jgi:hypothetical protein
MLGVHFATPLRHIHTSVNFDEVFSENEERIMLKNIVI